MSKFFNNKRYEDILKEFEEEDFFAEEECGEEFIETDESENEIATAFEEFDETAEAEVEPEAFDDIAEPKTVQEAYAESSEAEADFEVYAEEDAAYMDFDEEEDTPAFVSSYAKQRHAAVYDEDEEEDDDKIGGVISLKAIQLVLGALCILLIVVFGVHTYLAAQKEAKQVEANYGSLGQGLEDVEVLGGDGLLALKEAMLAAKVVEEEPIESSEYQEVDVKADVQVSMVMTSVQKDLKIKFTNKKTGKLIANVPFEVEVTNPSGKTSTWTDEDMDGIVYMKNIDGGKYTVTLKQLKDEKYQKYLMTASEQVSVKEKIEYVKVDVSAEVKSESEINVSKEEQDTPQTPVEEVIEDTVLWVESTKTYVGDSYKEISKSDIQPPVKPTAQTASAGRQRALSMTEVHAVVTTALQQEDYPTALTTAAQATVYPMTLTMESGATPSEPTTESGTEPSEPTTVTMESGATPSEPTTESGAKPSEPTTESGTEPSEPTTESGTEPSEPTTESGTEPSEPTTESGTEPSEPTTESGTEPTESTEQEPSALLTKTGKEVFVKDGEKYKAATSLDYEKKDMKFYIKEEGYKYTGWNTIDGALYYFDVNGKAVTGEQIIRGVIYQFGADGKLASDNGVLGIDVSSHNGSIDWNAVAASGVKYVIIRCGYRGYGSGVLVEDSRYRTNIQGALNAGLKVGVYFFSQALDEIEAVEEASMVLNAVSGYQITFPIFLDVEYSNSAKDGRADGLNKDQRTAICNAFCRTISNAGYRAGVYANKDWLTNHLNPGQFDASTKIWLAQYAKTPNYGGRYEMWQYSSTGTISGIKGNVDLNMSYLGY